MNYYPWHWLVFPLFWILIFWLLASWRWGGRRRYWNRNRDRLDSYDRDPLDYAKERYAKGEISHAELEEIRKNLSK